jgi:Holliday junction DNA helicase RuvA
MISYLKGAVLEKGKDFLIVLAGDLGYRVSVTSAVLGQVAKSDKIELYTQEVIREDSRELFGFPSMKELEFFWRLTTVSGVGPKMAMHIISLGTVESVSKAIDKGDIEYIESAQGVGKKTAQRVVLELKGKLVGDGEFAGEAGEVVSALENLGYHRAKAREAVGALTPGGTTEDRIKAALKYLSK